MVIRRDPNVNPRHREHGAALVVSLILLLIMTIVGVTAMNGARLEVKMAGMMQREEVALRDAERTLAAAEKYTNNAIGDSFNASVQGHYLPDEEPVVSTAEWSENATVEVAADTTTPGLRELTEDDAIMVQYQGVIALDGSSLNDGGDLSLPGDKVNTYRITARNGLENGEAVRIVESIYTKLYNPMAPQAVPGA